MKMHVENEAPCWGRTTNPSRRVTSLLVIPFPCHIYSRLCKGLPRIKPSTSFSSGYPSFSSTHPPNITSILVVILLTSVLVVILDFKDIKNHNQHDFMNMFIKRRLVSAQILGRHQDLIIRESACIQKLLIIKRQIAPFTSRYLKNIRQEFKVKITA